MVPFAQAHTFTRAAAGSYVNGTYVPGASTSFTAMCSIQPVSEQEVDITPREGGRWLDGLVSVDSETEVRESDRTTYNGALFEVIRVSDWPHLPNIAHYEAIAQRINGNTNA